MPRYANAARLAWFAGACLAGSVPAVAHASLWEVNTQTTASVTGSGLGSTGGLGRVDDQDSTTFTDNLMLSARSSSQIFGGLAQADSFARASLINGTMRVSAGGTHVEVPDGNGGCCFYWIGGATAETSYKDRLVFQVDGASASQDTPIQVEFLAHGFLQGLAHWQYTLALTQDGVKSSAGADFNVNSGVWQQYVTGFEGVEYSPLSNHKDYFSGIATFNLTGPTSLVELSSDLLLDVERGGYSDFSHTAAMRFILPSNVTFTSASGGFLSDPYLTGLPGAVPEASTWAMMIIGFGFVGGQVRSRRRNRKCADRTADFNTSSCLG